MIVNFKIKMTVIILKANNKSIQRLIRGLRKNKHKIIGHQWLKKMINLKIGAQMVKKIIIKAY